MITHIKVPESLEIDAVLDARETLQFSPDELRHLRERAARYGTQPLALESEQPVARWGSLLARSASLRLHIVGQRITLSLSVGDDPVTLGRGDVRESAQPEVDLSPFGGYRKGLSRRHAQLFIEDNMLKLVDLGSTNGTYLNGCQMLPHAPLVLRDGDEIQLGKLVLFVRQG